MRFFISIKYLNSNGKLNNIKYNQNYYNNTNKIFINSFKNILIIILINKRSLKKYKEIIKRNGNKYECEGFTVLACGLAHTAQLCEPRLLQALTQRALAPSTLLLFIQTIYAIYS